MSSRDRRRWFTAGVVAALGGGLVAGVVPTATAARDGIAGFTDQRVEWRACAERPPLDPSEEPDEGIVFDPWQGQWGQAECATVIVPLDYRRPGDGSLSIGISRIKAADPALRKGVVLLNPGGPGGGGLSMPLQTRGSELAKHFDVIGFDPRGVGRSSALKCERIPDTRPRTTRPTDEEFAAYTEYARAHEDACRRAGGGIRPFINTANTARDMDVIRAVLGESKINYVGYSYGTYLGAVYGSLFPRRLNRSVLDSSVHPDWLWREQGKQQSVAARFNVEQWATWVARRDDTYHLGKTLAEVLATTEALAARLATRSVPLTLERPENWPTYWPRAFDRTVLDQFLARATQPRSVWDVTAEVVAEVRRAAEEGTAVSADASTAVGLVQEQGIVKVDDGVYDTVTCEADWPTDLATYHRDMRTFRERYPYSDGNGSGVIGAAPDNCTFRSFTPPEKLVPLRRDGYPTGLVIQADGDPATQYDSGPAMAAKLGNQLISVRDSGVHGHYGTNRCVTEKVDDYLIHGVLPPSRSECADEPRPAVPADGFAAGARSAVRDTKADRVRAAVGDTFWR
ncbi:alpha/beta hydrolase [Umezawaea endophytica]|uniref:Alpha/beta hydrolase n=1 Tax=Umezawaea endophytica TaxID=1654476 RepID=A0A9X2VMH7_9PSEU|nr:alpha/beta hydrolase [Umezawaea endophytica]MCS7479217.1 alpha/beta hydrolase [Umezawaea endophytica]